LNATRSRFCDYANKAACGHCPLRRGCTDAGYRAVSRLEHEDALDRMAARLEARPEILERRRETVEHPLGSIKQWMNQGAFLMRGLSKVRAEFALTALASHPRRRPSFRTVCMTAARVEKSWPRTAAKVDFLPENGEIIWMIASFAS